MRLSEVQDAASTGARWCAVGLGFSIPISTALDNILLVLFIVLWLASGNFAARLNALRNHPVSMTSLCFAGALLLGTLWSFATAAQLRESLNDALRFILIGMFALAFLDASTRDRAQFAFLATSALILVLSFVLASGVVDTLPGVKGRPDYPVVFKYHITHNLLMATAALLFALHALDARSRQMRMLFWLLAGAAAVNVFLLIPGRTGQLALAAAIMYLGLARLRWRGAMIAAAALAGLGAVVFLTPGSVMYERMALAVQESIDWKPEVAQAESSSVGMRLEYYRNSLELIGERPVIGVGTGAFRAAYEAKVRGTLMAVANHPHNAFLYVAVELGLIGLAVLLVLLIVQWRSAGTLSEFTDRAAARGLVVIFVAAGLVSSTFSDHAEGLFFAWGTGLLFALAGRPGQASS